MKTIVKLVISCIICLGGILLIYILGVLLYSYFSEFKPAQVEELTIQIKGQKVISTHQELSLLTWNIGYGGLGKEMDFFYEGGKMARPDKNLSTLYLKGITDFLKKQDSLDFIMLQEVDFDAKRSFEVDQSLHLSAALTQFNEISAVNYFSKYVPVPFLHPMGKVKSGLVTLSKYVATAASRMATPGEYPIPKRLFMLKRCLLVLRYETDNGKDLVLINLHNSAFDDAHELRKEELDFLKQIISKEYEKGNYIIAGGDWNQNPPGLDMATINKYKTRKVWPIEKDFLPTGWNWAFDPSVPTNRDVHESFNIQTTTCTILDYFVTSPNIEVLQIKTVDLEFEDSDHQPVIVTLKLK